MASCLNESLNEASLPRVMPSQSSGATSPTHGRNIFLIFHRSILSGVKYLHDHDIVHRDLKCVLLNTSQ